MKKFKYVIFVIISIVCMLFVPIANNVAIANSGQDYTALNASIESEIKNFVGLNTNSAYCHERFAGTKGEKDSALYIKNRMQALGYLGLDNQSTNQGIQEFLITLDDGVYTSQNVIFTKKSTNPDAKKVIIATHYDNQQAADFETGELVGSEGVYSSGAGVGLTLALASQISSLSYDFDIEFVFFGAKYLNNAGSAYYTSFISSEEAEDILLMINFDRVVSGGSLYLYTGEFSNPTDEFVYDNFSKQLNVRNASEYNFIATVTDSDATGLGYTHIGLDSSVSNFIRINVKTLNVLSIDDSNIVGLKQIDYKVPVSIIDDTFASLSSIYGDKLLLNLSNIAIGTLDLLSAENFSTTLAVKGDNNIYKTLGDDKLFIFIASIVFVLICFICYLIIYKLRVQAEEAKKACNFDQMMSEVMAKNYTSIDELINEISSKIEKATDKNKKKDDSENSEKNDTKKEN